MLDKLLNNQDFLITIGIDEAELIQNAENTINSAEESLELELNTTPSEHSIKYLLDEIESLETELTVKANTLEADEILDELLDRQYQLDVHVNAVLGQELDKNLEKIKSFSDTLSLIGENY